MVDPEEKVDYNPETKFGWLLEKAALADEELNAPEKINRLEFTESALYPKEHTPYHSLIVGK